MGAIASSVKGDGDRFEKIDGVRKLIGGDGMTRYYSGIFATADEARKAQDALKTKGFKDSFIAAFYGAKRISVAEANELLKRK